MTLGGRLVLGNLLLALVLVCGVAKAGDDLSGFPQGLAVRVAVPPVLDGRVIDDPAWTGVAPLPGEFTQTTPNAGVPATERTEVRIAFDDETLYFGVICFDREPQGIVVAESRRDSPLDETDSFRIILDTFLDRRNGFVFGTNPTGLEYDGQVVNEGEGGGRGGPPGGPGRQQAGGGGGFNLNWDGAWQVSASQGDHGWSAEFAIPFRTLRYARGGTQRWGVNFQRNIRRHNETAYWAPLERQYDLYRLSSAGVLELGAPSQRNLKLIPYVLGSAVRDFSLGGDGAAVRDETADVGGDLKWSVTPSLTLDLTANTDFAQVEVDELQTNLDRFNLFFPEKRPFFLENAGLFAVGNPGDVELFFSRRIGIGPEGEVVPILGGGRLSGKLGQTGIGVLNMQTRSLLGVTPANNFTVLRVNHELRNRSGVGAIFVNRQATGDLAGDDDHNRTYGVDGRWGIGEHIQLSGWAARTDTPGIDASDYAYHAEAVRTTPAWRLNFAYTEVGAGFNPEAGFLRRSDYRNVGGGIFHTHRVRNFAGLHEIRPHASYSGFWKPDGFQESGFLHVDTHWEWKNAWEVHTGVNVVREGVVDAFEIVPGVVVPPGTYDHEEAALVFLTNQGAPLSYSAALNAGGFFGGNRTALNQTLRFRIAESLDVDTEWERNDVSLPGGDFVANRLRIRASYSFTPNLFVQALLQYTDIADFWSTNLRFGWLQRSNTGLFVVYNETRDTATGSPIDVRDRSLTVKFSRMFDLLR
jgi:Domain of unknown function (DUF5916)